MKKLIFLLFLMLLLAGCGKHSESSLSVSTGNNQLNNSSAIVKDVGKKELTTSKTGYKKFNLAKYKLDLEKKLFVGNEKILSGMNQVLTQVKNNIQVFNTQGLSEFKKMLALHEENLKLMQQLVSLQKKRYDCFTKKYDILNNNPLNLIKDKKEQINRSKGEKQKINKSLDKNQKKNIENLVQPSKTEDKVKIKKGVKKIESKKEYKNVDSNEKDNTNVNTTITGSNDQKINDKESINVNSGKKGF